MNDMTQEPGQGWRHWESIQAGGIKQDKEIYKIYEKAWQEDKIVRKGHDQS